MYYTQTILWVNLNNQKLCAGTQKPPVDGPKYKKIALRGDFFIE